MELTGNSCCCAGEAVAEASIASATTVNAARAIVQPPSNQEARSEISGFIEFGLRRNTDGESAMGLFLLQPPIDKLSILLVCGFSGTWFVGAADIFLKLATMVDRKCSSFS